MNKIFKTILNKNTNQSTVASELAKGHGRVKNTCKTRRKCAIRYDGWIVKFC